MKHLLLVVIIFTIGLLACDSDEGEVEDLNFLYGSFTVEEVALIYQEALSQFEFSCDYQSVPTSAPYFTGKINGNDVCFVPDGLRYREIGFRVPTVVSLGPKPTYENAANVVNYQFGIGAVDFDNLTDDRIRIETPAFPQSASARVIVANSLQLTDQGQIAHAIQRGKLPLTSNEVSPIEGFNVNIEFSYDTPLDDEGEYADVLHTITLQTAFGDQEDSQLLITDVAEAESDSTITYDLTLALNCKLYWQRGEEMVYFGRLEDGILRTKIVLDK